MNLVVPLISFAVFLQTIEHLLLYRKMKDLDPWVWPNIPEWIWPVLLSLRLAAAFVCIFWALTPLIYLLFLTTFFIGVRYRGTFNGGSDAMTFHILAAVLGYKIFVLDDPSALRIAITYIALLATSSYFFAGLSKLNSKAWRRGEALPRFLLFSNASYPNRFGQVLADSPRLSGVVSFTIIVWEITFPLALLSPYAMAFYLPLGILFHIGNFYFFGLNRFFWAWLAAYPAIYYFALGGFRFQF